VSGLKDEKLIKKQICTKTEACKLYSRKFWILLPNVIKIDHYNFELYCFKVGTFFEIQCSIMYDMGRFCTEKLELEINTSAVRIFEISSYLLFDSKLTQLFEIFEYSFNCDQPGDWDAICLYFASHKPLYSPVSWTQCCAACVPTPPTPLTTAWELLQAAAWTVTLDRVITAGGKHSARSVEH